MNKKILTIVLASVIPFSAYTFADTTKATSEDSAMILKQQFKRDEAKLNLTPEQKTKISEIIKDHKKDLDEDIRDELNDTQKATFDQIQTEHKSAWSKSSSSMDH